MAATLPAALVCEQAVANGQNPQRLGPGGRQNTHARDESKEKKGTTMDQKGGDICQMGTRLIAILSSR